MKCTPSTVFANDPPQVRGIAALLLLAVILHPQSLPAQQKDSLRDLGPYLQPFHKQANNARGKVPAVAAMVIKDGRIFGTGAVGVRKLGDKTSVTRGDKFHWGSCTNQEKLLK